MSEHHGQSGASPPEQDRPDLYLQAVQIEGTVVETFSDYAMVEVCDGDGATLALLDVPYEVLDRAVKL